MKCKVEGEVVSYFSVVNFLQNWVIVVTFLLEWFFFVYHFDTKYVCFYYAISIALDLVFVICIQHIFVWMEFILKFLNH